MSSLPPSDIFSRTPSPPNTTHLPIHMSRPDLEGFCFYQHDIILQQDATNAYLGAIIEDLQSILMRCTAELVDAQHDVRVPRQVLSTCRENMKYLRQMLGENDELIARLSTGLAELVMQQTAAEAADEEREEEVEIPISPLQLPSPAFSHSSSPGPLHRPGAHSTVSRKRDRSSTYSAPIEAPQDAKKNGRPSHRTKRVRYHVDRHQGYDSYSSSSSSSYWPTSSSMVSSAVENEAKGQLVEERLRRALAACFL